MGERDVDTISDAALGSAGGHEVALLARQRDRRDSGAVVLRRVERQRTPAAPDVDEVRARRECQLATDEVELGALRCGEPTGTVAVTVAVAGVRPVAAGCAGSPDAAQRVGEIALDVEIAGHVRPGEPELAGLPDEVSKCSP